MPSFKKSLIVEQFQGNYLKFSLHMNDRKSGFQLFIVCLFLFFFVANKAAPTKVKANRRKPRTLVYRVSVKINLQKKLGVVKKLNIPFLVLFTSWRKRTGRSP